MKISLFLVQNLGIIENIEFIFNKPKYDAVNGHMELFVIRVKLIVTQNKSINSWMILILL